MASFKLNGKEYSLWISKGDRRSKNSPHIQKFHREDPEHGPAVFNCFYSTLNGNSYH